MKLKFPKDEEYVPSGEVDLIPKRIKVLNTRAFFVEKVILAQVAREDAIEGAKQPPGALYPDTTGKVSFRLGKSAWGLINAVTP